MMNLAYSAEVHSFRYDLLLQYDNNIGCIHDAGYHVVLFIFFYEERAALNI